uniref:FAR1 domain-containing protein n=1 Tax=Syphacia muris TaxID=451379 RepID=A0A0N5ADI4_9BILA
MLAECLRVSVSVGGFCLLAAQSDACRRVSACLFVRVSACVCVCVSVGVVYVLVYLQQPPRSFFGMPPKKDFSVSKGKEEEKSELVDSGKRKFNMRNYIVRAQFNSTDDFEEWIAAETEKAPWYMVSAYTAGGTTKRIYACAFRKRAGFKKCERQLKVEFYQDGKVKVMDSSDSDQHIHEISDGTSNGSKLRTLTHFRNAEAFNTWMEDQMKRFPWKRRTGQGTNVEVYQCCHRPRYGRLCRRILQAVRTPNGIITVKEPEGLPPHDHPPLPNKRYSYSEGYDEDEASSSSSRVMSLRKRGRFSKENETEQVANSTSEFRETDIKQVPKLNSCIKSEPSLEDFVIVSDEFYESDMVNNEKAGDSNVKQMKIEAKDDYEDNDNPSRNLGGSEKEHDGQLDVGRTDDVRYDLKYFEKELVLMLSKTPLERLPEVREKLRREMDLVYARQIVNEIATGFNSEEGRREVIDRINGVLHGI